MSKQKSQAKSIKGKDARGVRQFEGENDLTLILSRLQAVERRISALEERRFPDFSLPSRPTEVKRRPGPKNHLPIYELARRRDALQEWAGPRWPELLEGLRKVRTEGEVRSLFGSFSDIPQGVKFHESPSQVIDLLKSIPGKAKYPRWNWSLYCFADALAGVPEYEWRTSLNLCQREDRRIAMHPRAWRSHVQRRFPHKLRAIEQCESESELRKVLRAIRTDDLIIVHFKAMSLDQVRKVLEEGKVDVPKPLPPPLLANVADDMHRSAQYKEHNGFSTPGCTPHSDLNLRCNCIDCRIEDGRASADKTPASAST